MTCRTTIFLIYTIIVTVTATTVEVLNVHIETQETLPQRVQLGLVRLGQATVVIRFVRLEVQQGAEIVIFLDQHPHHLQTRTNSRMDKGKGLG